MSNGNGKRPSIMVSFPAYKRAEDASYDSVRAAMIYAMDLGYEVWFNKIQGESLITRARQTDLGEFLLHKQDFLITVDSDILVDQDIFVRLVKHDLDIVGALVRVKSNKDFRPAAWFLNHRMDELRDSETTWDEFMSGHLEEVRYLGTGVMCVKRSTILKMIEAHPELKYTCSHTQNTTYALYLEMVMDDQFLSEDYAFCHRARELGFKVFADTSLWTGHIGRCIYNFQIPQEVRQGGFRENVNRQQGSIKEPPSVPSG